MKRPSRNHSPVFKAKVALEPLKGEKRIASGYGSCTRRSANRRSKSRSPMTYAIIGSMKTMNRIAVQRGLFISGIVLFVFQFVLVLLGQEPFKWSHFVLPILICLSVYYELRRSR
jgi:hypothetical protein